jgi:hypothetical protein
MSDQPDVQQARAFLLETAIEMFMDDGHSRPEAERLAHELLASPVEFTLPDVIELTDMTDEQQRIVAAGQTIAGRFPQGQTKEALSAWIMDEFDIPAAATPIDPENPPLRDKAKLGSWKERFLQKADEHRAKWELAKDIQAAATLFLESAIEMYRQRGHLEAEAKKLAEALVNSPAKFQLPE